MNEKETIYKEVEALLQSVNDVGVLYEIKIIIEELKMAKIGLMNYHQSNWLN